MRLPPLTFSREEVSTPAANVASVLWQDSQGHRSVFRVNAGAAIAPLLAAMAAASNGDWTLYWESAPTSNGAPVYLAAAYPTVADRASLLFQCADGTEVALLLPAPRLSDFLADGQTIDPASVLIAALIAAAIALPFTNAAGSPVVAYTGGTRAPYARIPL